MTETEQLDALTEWLRGRPGVFVTRDEISTWRAAHRMSGVDCSLSLFRFHVRRAGFDVRPIDGGVLLDLSEGHLLVALGVE